MAMSDNTSLVALVVAVVALAIASIQLTQQLLATGYVIRKCDRIATGGLTKGGTRKWHWRQFRFTVKYQAIVFSLPPSLYGSLGLKPAIQVAHYDLEIANRARSARPRRSPAQGCWVSLVQDLVHFSCLNPQHIGLSAESGDRIPDDLTVAPTKIDAITVLLCSIAMGMQVFKYSPTTGEVVLGGGSRSISSSAHPILGGLLHYSFFSNQPVIGKARAMRHGRALRNDKGVWANAVFGMFRDRSFRPGFQTLEDLRPRWKKLVLQEGWPNEGLGEDASRAACFLTFAYVDYYIVAPPSVSRYGCVSFAEAILKMQHWEILLESFTINKVDAVYDIGESFRHSRSDFVNFWGCSSPFLPWPQCDFPFLLMDHERDAVPDYERFLVFSALLEDLKPFRDAYGTDRQRYKKDLQDPSSYISPEVAWEMIQRLDQCMSHASSRHPTVHRFADQVASRAISCFAEVGAPSWTTLEYSSVFERWRTEFEAACSFVLQRSDTTAREFHRESVRQYAYMIILRASYFTIMMRSAHKIGPGLTESGSIETALLYMA